jgi:hypothetical protein
MIYARPLLLATLIVFFPLVGYASTLPRVDFKEGDRIVAGGLLDVNFDYALTDKLSLGASLIPSTRTYAWYDPILSPVSVALRSTYRLGVFSGAVVGLTLSGGAYEVIPANMSSQALLPGTPFFHMDTAIFVQPALNVALPLGAGEGHWTVRATLGPSFILDPQNQNFFPLWPNIEMARSFGDHGELTLLGNALVGWRSVF